MQRAHCAAAACAFGQVPAGLQAVWSLTHTISCTVGWQQSVLLESFSVKEAFGVTKMGDARGIRADRGSVLWHCSHRAGSCAHVLGGPVVEECSKQQEVLQQLRSLLPDPADSAPNDFYANEHARDEKWKTGEFIVQAYK